MHILQDHCLTYKEKMERLETYISVASSIQDFFNNLGDYEVPSNEKMDKLHDDINDLNFEANKIINYDTLYNTKYEEDGSSCEEDPEDLDNDIHKLLKKIQDIEYTYNHYQEKYWQNKTPWYTMY